MGFLKYVVIYLRFDTQKRDFLKHTHIGMDVDARVHWMAMKTMMLFLVLFALPAVGQVHVLYDDDCTNDNDCPVNFATLHKLADAGEITILATVADSANPLSAPAMKVFNTYYGRPGIVVGANQTAAPDNPLCVKNECNKSTWLGGVVSHFDLGDTRAKYPDCVTVYQETLAKEEDHSVVVVATGFLTCLAQLLASPGGTKLVKAKVSNLVVMGGAYPKGMEFNLDSDPVDSAAVFSTWTTAHGYPPVWLISFADGAKALSGPPATDDPTTHPGVYAFQLAKSTQRGSWDSMSILYAARGLAYKGTAYWTDSGDGTVAMDVVTGADTFSTGVASGHHFLINAMKDEGFSAILDGYKHKGFAAMAPKAH
jgi:hypothetical protein